jgi:hypothetical protein
MQRADLEHLMAAAAEVSEETEFVVVGSQAILATHPEAPEGMLRSMEADVYPRSAPEKAEAVEGSLGGRIAASKFTTWFWPSAWRGAKEIGSSLVKLSESPWSFRASSGRGQISCRSPLTIVQA